MVFLAFHTVIATIEATASFKHLRLAFRRTSTEDTLSESLVRVMVRAVDLIALFISSVILMHDLSSLVSLNGIVTAHEDRIFPISNPFAKVTST